MLEMDSGTGARWRSKDYNSSPTQCADLGYLEIQPQPGDLRFTQEPHAPSPLTIDPPQSSPLLNLFHPSSLHATTPYSQDAASAFYPPQNPLYGSDVRPRLNSSTTSLTGMAHAPTNTHRTGALPHLVQQLGAREQYSTTTPSFRRASEHLSRSPSFAGASQRRHQLTASQGSLPGFAPPPARMDSGQYANRSSQTPVPPLQPVQTLGTLQYQNESAMSPTPITVEIHGTVDKGPFLSCDQEWTCYRRNYLACVCSYTLSPYYPNIPIQFIPASTSASPSGQPCQVFGFAMCISAVVAENDQQSIDLVQHTPKRDKGPINKPSKVALAPKTGSSTHHSMMPYGDGSTTRGLYSDGFGTPHTAGQQLPAEHTFERIQFKQATQNNGKRRAAQQYYQLIVELWADVGGPEHYVKVAYRKSAKMIVRGRSPGHYQNERRGSQGSGPGGSAGNLGGYAGMGPMGDFNSNSMLGGAGTGGYATTYDSRGNMYGGARTHEMPDDSLISPDDGKVMDNSKAYHYYPGAIYDGHHERVDMFNHRSGPEGAVIPSMAPDAKVKNEYELGLLPRPYNTMPRVADQRQHDHFSDGKATAGGYYPSIVSPTGINITMA